MIDIQEIIAQDKSSRPLSSYIVGKVLDRALIEIKENEYDILLRILYKFHPFKKRPIVYQVDNETGCWICRSTSVRTPYPMIIHAKKNCKVARLMYEEFTGVKPGKDQILHKCDNPGCINPDHLYLGTPADNIRDWRERGRSKYPSIFNRGK